MSNADPLAVHTCARIVAMLRPVRLEAVLAAVLGQAAPAHLIIEQVRGYGRQKDHLAFYEETFMEGGFLPKVRLEFTVMPERVEHAVEAVRTAGRTGRIGDGKIFVFLGEQP